VRFALMRSRGAAPPALLMNNPRVHKALPESFSENGRSSALPVFSFCHFASQKGLVMKYEAPVDLFTKA
jgi:hypothetical protein